MKRTGRIFLAGALLIIFNCFILQSAYPEELETVKVYYKPTIGLTPVTIAIEEGFFKEQGIKVELVKANMSSEIWLLIIGGAVDVTLGAPAPAMYSAAALNKNLKFVACSNYLVRGNRSEGLGIRNDSGNKSDINTLIRNLKNKKVGILQLGSLPSYLIEAAFKKNGMSVKDVELVNMPLSSMAQALESGVLSAGVLTEPFASILRDKYKDKISIIPFGDIFPDSPYIFMIYGEKLLVKNQDLGVRFMAAWLKGFKQYSEGKTGRNMEIIKKYTDLDEETQRKIDWVTINPDGIYNCSALLNNYQEWLIDGHFIDKKVSVDSMVDTTFLERAKKIVK